MTINKQIHTIMVWSAIEIILKKEAERQISQLYVNFFKKL
jgi:hypothetical protein